ncbi:MAG: pantoate--beta-alanine ligase [Candidatus Eremiobacteraeota bacterium]|nr:pantoate--beta-alanine ligase [Candidatus Eremiobacteraeota bacterium]
MFVATTIAAARERVATLARPLGFVPTMGALHSGHMHLVDVAREHCASVAVSVFVNPLQFGPSEDLERYPRDFEGDLEMLEAAGVALIFSPDANEMYPPGFSTFVEVGAMGSTHEGKVRPTHFRGVATVVAKLLHIVEPDSLYLGQKDAQQTAVLRRMVRDLAFDTRVEIVPTQRETDGLARSSRNVYLSEAQRAAAPSLYATLKAMADALRRGASVSDARETARRELSPQAELEYLDVVDATTFEPMRELRPPAFIVGAARFGATRLIDNLWITS